MVQRIFKSKGFPVFLFLLATLLALPSLFYIYFSIWTYSWESLFGADLEYILLIAVPVLVFAFSLLILAWAFKAFLERDFFLRFGLFKKILLYSHIFLGLGTLGLFGFSFYRMFNGSPYQPFPLDDPEAIYTISKQHGLYMINYETTSDRNKKYVCSYERGKKSCRWDLDQSVMGFIASSNLDLEQFMDKKVKLTGEFIYVKEQCNAGKCIKFGDGTNNFLGLKINTIKKIE